MKNVKLIVATHKKFQMPKDSELYIPIHVGREGKPDIGYIGDNIGDNISKLNPYYCELTGLYWAWKNLDYDYLGLVHYRRYFTSSSKRYHDGTIIDDVILNKEQVNSLLEQSDVIVPKKRRYYIETLYSHYDHTLDGSHLDKAREIIAEISSEYLKSYDKVMRQRSGYMFNMFIMRKELIDSYLTWLFPILDKLYENVDMSNYTPFEARLYGRVSELLFNVWLDKNEITPKEVPFMYMENINLLKKGTSFLQAKFMGKKYGKSF